MHIKVTSSDVEAIDRKDGKGKFYKAGYILIAEEAGERIATKARATFNSPSDWGLAPGEYDIDADKAVGVDRFGAAYLTINRHTLVARK